MENKANILSEKDLFTKVDAYLDAVFNRFNGYINYEELGIDKKSFEKDKVYLTYGEIKTSGLDQMIKLAEIDEGDVFYDLGSGVGKVCSHVFLKSKVKRSIGIEYNSHRHQDAIEALTTIKADLPEAFGKNREMSFYEGNILTSDISDATVILLCSTCYGQDLMEGISNQINDTCMQIKHVFSLKQVPNLKLSLKDKIAVPCSWESKSNLYWYSNL